MSTEPTATPFPARFNAPDDTPASDKSEQFTDAVPHDSVHEQTASHDATSRHAVTRHAAPTHAAPASRSRRHRQRRQSHWWDRFLALLPATNTGQAWLAIVVTTLLGAIVRLPHLGHPRALMFDETYYVKDAYALGKLGYEGSWSQDANPLFARGDMGALSTDPAFIVHPQLGKWLINVGMAIVGADNPVGWRLMPALAGIATIALAARLMWHLSKSPLLTGLTGLFIALDGVGISESRIALLDVFLAPFTLAALICLVRDRQEHGERVDAEGPDVRAGARRWLIGAGVLMGCALAVKWSALYMIAVMGVTVWAWDMAALKRAGSESWLVDGVLKRGVGDFVRLVGTALVVYLASWWSWFTHPRAYGHGWAAAQRAAGESVSWGFLPDSLRDLLHYHELMYTFHVSLESDHPYASNPLGWLFQLRPTSFFWPSTEELGDEATSCGAQRCVQAITSVGNIPLWWLGVVALVGLIVVAIRTHDWRAWVIMSGYVGYYVPWLMYMNRTIFTFYTVAFMPFVAMAVAWMLGWLMREAPENYRRAGMITTAAAVAAVIIFAMLWMPLWRGSTISYDWWYWHMWFESWI